MGYKLGGANAKGDILVSDGAGNLNQLPVGADGQALIADAVSATGVKWNTPTPVDVPGAIAGAPLGGVGTYALLVNTNQTVNLPGAILAGSSLFYANTAEDPGGAWVGSCNVSAAGSWRLLGNTGYYSLTSTITQIAKMVSLWVRVA